jgi:ribosomal protein S18 acetylase RimI-like enzyme
MTSRPATPEDLPAIAELNRRWEIANFGAEEQSADEVREHLGRVSSFETDTLLVVDGDKLLGVGARIGSDTMTVADPDVDTGPVYDELLAWFAGGTPDHVEALSKDHVLLDRLAAHDWQHTYSAFELLRTVDDTLVLPEPGWPDGVTVRGWRDDDAEAVHHLIYVDAAWAEVPGHPFRGYDEWRSIFLGEHLVPEQQVLAERDGRLVGVAMGRTWDDGTGWVSQLATAKDERGRGLGRALLAASLRLRVDAGARAIGLQVQAANRGALAMYLAAGLEIDREWMTFQPSASPPV